MKRCPVVRRVAPLAILAAALLAGCASAPEPLAVQPPAPVETKSPEAVATATDPRDAAMQTPLPALPPPAAAARAAAPDRFGAKARVATLLPPSLTKERSGWAADIAGAFAALRLAPSDANYCAAIAVIEQESGFVADPVVPGLSKIAWREIDARRKRFGIPQLALDAALAKQSPDGRTYRRRLDTLRTERQMSALYDDMIAELPGGSLLLRGYNPVRTGGPMQVSVAFAEVHARRTPYRGARGEGIRDAVFTRRGGVHFGIAHLLDYPAPYDDPVFRFADFNAGHYSSRNAAFQQAVGRLTKTSLVRDGDLLRYADGRPSEIPSATQGAVHRLARRLRLDARDIDADLRLEKTDAFARTEVYRRVFALADRSMNGRAPRAVIPRIDLKSPKIQRKLTTEWFANRVKMRYGHCMTRAAKTLAAR